MSSNSKSTIISLAAVVLAVVAILLSFCRGHHDTVSFGTLATVLSILVTILVTWNIYTLVDFKENIKEFKEMKNNLNNLKKETDSTQKETEILREKIDKSRKITVKKNIGELGKPGNDDQTQDIQN